MKLIKLTKYNKHISVDDNDFNNISLHTWQLAKGVIQTSINGKTKVLSRYLLNLTGKKLRIDHRDRNIFNNQRNNLRICTPSQNAMNSPYNSLGFKGVREKKGRFSARITYNKQQITIGTYSTAEQAAKEYAKKAFKLFGEFAYLNSNRGL